ncbi:MAG: hypothetical protein C0606_10600 [Hyphomicrobiales bacterium]|nr:MAG: hypothetical protein C0606_10600 [Hyphomicrobiales bacterium]
MTTISKTAISTFTAAALLAGSLAATTTSASAGMANVSAALTPAVATTDGSDANVVKVGWRHRHHRRHHYGPAAAGLVFGLATGAMIANSYAPRDCYWTTIKKKRWNRYGERVIIKKRVKVCD